MPTPSASRKTSPTRRGRSDRTASAHLRKVLADAANDLAAELRESVEQITWPVESRVQSSNIHSAFFEFLYGHRVNRLTAILKARGVQVL
jgi:hypothetical protein